MPLLPYNLLPICAGLIERRILHAVPTRPYTL